MKILFFCRTFPPKIGGLQKSNYEIAETLQKIGHDVNVLVMGKNKKNSKFDKEQKFSVKRTGFSEVEGKLNWKNLFLRILTLLTSYPRLIIEIIRKKPDKIIFGDDYARRILGLFPIKIFTNSDLIVITSVPRINETLDNQFLTKINKWIIKKCYKKSDKVAFVSKSTKIEIENFFGKELFKNKDTNILYRTVDDNFIEKVPNKKKIEEIKNKYNIKENRKVLLSVSRIVKEKGIDFTLEALKKYKEEQNKDFYYIIVGEGEYLPKIKQKVKELKLENNVIITGKIDFDKVIHFYDLCDIFILPSRRESSESFGRVFAEASARKKPVIGNNTGGVKEVIDNEETGFLVDPENIDEIYVSIKKLLSDKSLREKFGEKGRRKVEKNFTFRQLEKNLSKNLND